MTSTLTHAIIRETCLQDMLQVLMYTTAQIEKQLVLPMFTL